MALLSKKKFGEYIRNKRLERGLTQEELARILHVSNYTVSKWERGKLFPDFEMMDLISEALGVSMNDLHENAKVEERQSSVVMTIGGLALVCMLIGGVFAISMRVNKKVVGVNEKPHIEQEIENRINGDVTDTHTHISERLSENVFVEADVTKKELYENAELSVYNIKSDDFLEYSQSAYSGIAETDIIEGFKDFIWEDNGKEIKYTVAMEDANKYSVEIYADTYYRMNTENFKSYIDYVPESMKNVQNEAVDKAVMLTVEQVNKVFKENFEAGEYECVQIDEAFKENMEKHFSGISQYINCSRYFLPEPENKDKNFYLVRIPEKIAGIPVKNYCTNDTEKYGLNPETNAIIPPVYSQSPDKYGYGSQNEVFSTCRYIDVLVLPGGTVGSIYYRSDFEIFGESVKSDKIMSSERMMDIIKEKNKDLEKNVTITNIKLLYSGKIAKKDDGKYQTMLIPVWEVDCYYEGDSYITQELYDAVNGELMGQS